MVNTIKFSQMTDGGDIDNNKKVPGLKNDENVLFNQPWTFLASGTTLERPAPSADINYRLRFNTDDQKYEYYDAVAGVWTQLEASTSIPGPFVTYTADTSLPGAQNLGLLANGILKQTIALGSATINIAVQGTDYYGPGDIPTFAGMTLTGNLDMGGFTAFNAANPIQPQDYATKFYVDQNSLTGTSVYAASVASLGTVTQSGSGVGATLTNAGVQATFALDGVSPPVGVNVLIKNTAGGMTSANEGIYTVTDVGSGASNWVLTRATSYDTANEINQTGLIVIQNGSTLAGTLWYNTSTIVTVDTTAFSYNQFGGIYALKGANSDITSMTGLTGVISAPTAIQSSAGINVLTFTYTPLATDYIDVGNGLIGAGLQVKSSNTNSSMSLYGKGTGGVQIGATGGTTTFPMVLYNGTYTFGHYIPTQTANRTLVYPDSDVTLLTGAATQANQETATSTTTSVTPGRQQYHPSAAKVWILFNTTTTTTITASYNVTSLTDDGTGITKVNFTTAFSSANYCATSMAGTGGGGQNSGVVVNTYNTAYIQVIGINTTTITVADGNFVNVSCFGDQ